MPRLRPPSCGCYRVARPGSLDLRGALGEPESEPLLFAGEAVGTWLNGAFRTATITAALGSGIDAVNRIAQIDGRAPATPLAILRRATLVGSRDIFDVVP